MTNHAAIPTIADLWRELRDWLAAALRDWRGPVQVAEILACEAQRAIHRRLRMLESFLLKCLLIEAARLRRTLSAPQSRSASTPRAAAPSRRQEIASDPTTWRVLFRPRLAHLHEPHARAALGLRPAALCAAQRGTNAAATARRLARRFEALRRVIVNPGRAIGALARRLAASTQPRALARALALSRPRHSASAPLNYAHAMVGANDAAASFDDTS